MDITLVLGNDSLFWILQGSLILLVLRAIYVQRYKSKVRALRDSTKRKVLRGVRAIKNNLRKNWQKYYKKFRLFVRLDKPDKNIILSPDSVRMELSSTTDASIKVQRSEDSWQYFGLAWTVLSVFFIETNAAYSGLSDSEFSILLTIFNLASITWLCFVSSWFRNWIIRIANLRNKTPD